ncbi:hypothetical protein H9K76_15430 [Diaphorobacter ruginosibacter]|uniref:TubC N-terminal docking domain-containing protein n=1 Tax=Diaphorobacter ruginosibacter TaxID=1715720 RepID=A0A7G9RK50_9BURK|nr:hypothetical protein [Diaphorobacter ruginosibacter]QNN55975.1 hypothetical protein H9K76_15430 [Diaphorobacter ruginosibacter]
MSAEAILADLLAHGIEPEVTEDGAHLTVPAGVLTPDQRVAIRDNKAALILCIQESARTTAELLDAAMRACDHHNDSPQAREEMRRQCLEIPPFQRADLANHFKSQYPSRNHKP